MQKVRYIKLKPGAIVPKYGTASSAGADLFVCNDGLSLTVNPGQTVMAHTGIALEIPEGYVGLVYARSGMATKRGLAPANKVGVIDSDYRGEIMVPILNHSDSVKEIEDGERVAQIVITPYLRVEFKETDTLEETERSCGGFGSTGTR